MVLSVLPAVVRADPLSDYDDFLISAAVVEACHIVMPGRMNEAKFRATAGAAFQQLGGSAAGPGGGSHDEKDVEADNAVRKRTGIDIAKGRELVAAQGCPALITHAREVLGRYTQ